MTGTAATRQEERSCRPRPRSRGIGGRCVTRLRWVSKSSPSSPSEVISPVATAIEDDPRRFLHPETIARISRLDLRARHVVEGFISGLHKSPLFGHSVEFVQHREYVAGDDIRHLDWKVWSKTDRYYIKMFEEETNLRSTMVVDVSESMHYGRTALNKYNYACTIAACLGYLLLRQQDEVGLMSFDSKVRQVVPARSQQNHMDAIIKALDVSRPREKTDLEK